MCYGWQKHHWSLGEKSDSVQKRKTELHDLPYSGSLVTAVSPVLLQHADAIVCEDRRITTQHLALSLSLRKGSISTSFKILDIPWCVWNGFLTASWSNTILRAKPFLLCCWHTLKLTERPYPGLLQQIKPWSIVLNLRQKSQPMEWHYPQSSWKKKFSISVSGQVMATVFWDCEWVMLVDVVPRRETINCDAAYIRLLTELGKCFKWVQHCKNPTEILLQHDNARLHTTFKTQETTIQLGWTVLALWP